jgi:hypothetical protein
MGRFRQPDALSEPATTPPISRQPSPVPSNVSSTLSHKASILTRTVKKGVKDGVKAVVRPFKRARNAFSPRAKTSTNAAGDDLPALEDVDDSQDGDVEDESGAESLNDPKKRLGMCMIYDSHSSLLSGYSETKAYLAFIHLQFL